MLIVILCLHHPLLETELLEKENSFLKQTIVAVRSELEQLSLDHEDVLQSKSAESQKEISGLRETVASLRLEIESHQAASASLVQQRNRVHNQETQNLKTLVNKLRNELEGSNSKAEEQNAKKVVFVQSRNFRS